LIDHRGGARGERGLRALPLARWLLPSLALLFFLSGFSALIYQVLWLRLLSLVFGVTVHAASTVVAAFMGGLAVGSVLAGRLADRVRRPLLWFGAVEVLIALSALASSPALELVEGAFVSLAGMLPDSSLLLPAARFVTSFGLLLIPTLLMGATLPLVMRSSLASRATLRASVELLYGANTAGAVAGALVAGFVLVGRLGIWRSFLVAAGVNLLTGLGAASIDRFLPGRDGADDHRAAAAASGDGAGDPELAPAARMAVLAAFIVSGFASLALEVVWFRILVVHLGATAYAFVAMLSTYLSGIAIGSWAVVPLAARARNPLRLLVAVQAATGIVTLLSLAGVAAIFDRPRSGSAQITALAILPAALLMGAAFPVGLRLWAGNRGPDVSRRIGTFYALNVCGGIAGSIAAGFVLLPRVGARWSVIAAAALFVASALMLLSKARGPLVPRFTGAAAIVALSLWAASTLPDPFDVALSRHPRPIMWREEGVQTTVSVHRQPGNVLVMYLDGLHQANDSLEMLHTHRQIGLLPLALHPDPRDVLVIGLGGGATAGAVSRHAHVTVDVVELSQAVVRGATWFRHVNEDVVHAPNVRVRVDDGRNFLLLQNRSYDVITADIIQPVHAGAGNLYSAEYFRLGRAALNDGGLMLQWIGRREATQYKLIMRTFLSVFPHATLWADGSLMVGSLEPLRISRAAFERKLAEPSTAAALKTVGLDSFDALMGRYTAGPDEMRALVGDGEILTDDRPLIEYFRTLPRGEAMIDLSGVKGDVRRHRSDSE
jgi:spermidine synthase